MTQNKRDYADYLNAKVKTTTVGFQRFMLKFQEIKEKPICFVEGEDAKYYFIRVKSNCEEIDPVFITCGGKKGVVETFDLISNVDAYKLAKTFYFVDTDFDESLNNPYIYETPCYSIENLYTSVDVYKNILKYEFKIIDDESKGDFNKCVELYSTIQLEFQKMAVELNAWISCQKEKQSKGSSVRLNLNDKEKYIMENFFHISLAGVEKKYSIEKINQMFTEASIIPNEYLESKIFSLSKMNLQKTLRGKYEIAFLKKFLRLLANELNKRDSSFFPLKRKVSFQLRDTNVISELSQYAETPISLKKYIKKVWKGQVNDMSSS